MTTQTPENNFILEYHEKIQSGELKRGKKIKRWYKYVAERVHVHDQYHYEPSRAEHVIVFFESFIRHIEGEWGGQLVKLELWQKAFLSTIFGFVDDEGYRQYRQIILIIGKKNGKSFLAAGIALYLLIADGEPGAKIFSVAVSRDQASLVWKVARSMVSHSPELRKRARPGAHEITVKSTDSEYKAIASKVDSLDGKNPHGILMDEVQQWKNGFELYDIMARGVSARTQPMTLITTTAGTLRDDLYDYLYDLCDTTIKRLDNKEGYLDMTLAPVIYEIDARDEWKDRECWPKANPNYGVSKSEEYMENQYRLAMGGDENILKSMLTKDFNWPETSASTWLTWEALNDERVIDYEKRKPDYVVGGFDLSVRGDLTAAVLGWMYPDDPTLYVESMFWMPADVLQEHEKTDGQPYSAYVRNGYLRVCPGNQISYPMVKDWFVEMRDKYELGVMWIGYDPAYSAYLVDDLKLEFGENSMVPVRQGGYTFGMPMATLEKKFKAHEVCYNNNPLMRWNIQCVSVREDTNANLVPVKKQRNMQRIDGFMAMLDMWVVMQNNHDAYMSYVESMYDEVS